MNIINESVNAFHPISSGFFSVPHHAFVYGSKTSDAGAFKERITESSLPKPIFSVNFKDCKIEDQATLLVREKQRLEHETKLAKFRWKKSKKVPEGLISKELVDYIELSETPISPYVSADYDWHLTGGSLEIFKVGNHHRIAQISTDTGSTLRLLSPLKNFKHVNLESSSIRTNESFGYEIMKSESFLAVRRRNSIDFIRTLELEDLHDEYTAPIVFKWVSEIAASLLNKNEFIFADVQNNLYRTSTENFTVSSVVRLKDDASVEPLSIDYVSDNVVSFTNLKSLNLVDFRTEEVNSIFLPEHFHMNCEELTYHRKSLQENLLYLASSHLLYGIDYRFLKAPLLHWTHQLIKQPTMLKTVRYEGDEVICLSSNLQGDMKIFNCSKGERENKWTINYNPLKPKSIKNSYQTMRDQGLLLLSDPIKRRMQLSTTGIAMLRSCKKSQIALFSQNAIGDIYRSYLNCDGVSIDSNVKKSFLRWDESIKVEKDPQKLLTLEDRQQQCDLIFTDVVKLKGMRKVMRCEKLQAPNDHDDANQMLTKRAPRWKMDYEEAREYRDALSQHLLSEWNLQIDEARPQIFAEALAASDDLQRKKIDKVAMWLGNTTPDDQLDIKEENTDLQACLTQTFAGEGTQNVNLTQQSSKKTKISKRLKGF